MESESYRFQKSQIDTIPNDYKIIIGHAIILFLVAIVIYFIVKIIRKKVYKLKSFIEKRIKIMNMFEQLSEQSARLAEQQRSTLKQSE